MKETSDSIPNLPDKQETSSKLVNELYLQKWPHPYLGHSYPFTYISSLVNPPGHVYSVWSLSYYPSLLWIPVLVIPVIETRDGSLPYFPSHQAGAGFGLERQYCRSKWTLYVTLMPIRVLLMPQSKEKLVACTDINF